MNAINHNFSTGGCNHSTTSAFDSYTIFCVGQSLVTQHSFKTWAQACGIAYKELRGSYQGQSENSFMVNNQRTSYCYRWYEEEETVLMLSPLYRDGKMHGARLAKLASNTQTWELGSFRHVPKDIALAREAWTYDPSTGLYWITDRENWNHE